MAKEYLWQHRNGSIDCTHTYDDFVRDLKRVGDEKGNPPTDPEHQNPAPPIVSRLIPSRVPDPATTNVNVEEEVETEGTKERREELMKMPLRELKDRCKERDEKMSCTKKELVNRLLQKRKPAILITRARRKQHVPKVPSCNAAILVALHLHTEPEDGGLEKAKVMSYAEETGVSKDPMVSATCDDLLKTPCDT